MTLIYLYIASKKKRMTKVGGGNIYHYEHKLDTIHRKRMDLG